MIEADYEKIGKRIRELRQSRGLTQEQLSAAAEINVSHLSNIENHKVGISLDTFIKICNALDTSADYLLTLEDKRDKANMTVDDRIMEQLRRFSIKERERVLKIIELL